MTFNNYGVLTSASSGLTANVISYGLSFTNNFMNAGNSTFNFPSTSLNTGFKHNQQTMTNGTLNTSNSRFTALKQRLYRFTASAQFDLNGTGTARGLMLEGSNGIIAWGTAPPNTVVSPGVTIAAEIIMNVNDVATFLGYNDATTAISAFMSIGITFVAS